MSRVSSRRKSARPAAGQPRNRVAVDEEQRRHLAECCAFFMAARFRPRSPGGFRRQDLLDAKSRVDRIIEGHQRPRRRPVK